MHTMGTYIYTHTIDSCVCVCEENKINFISLNNKTKSFFFAFNAIMFHSEFLYSFIVLSDSLVLTADYHCLL